MLKRSVFIALSLTAFAIFLLVMTIIGGAMWWSVIVLAVAGCLVLLGLLPRARDPEIRGEDVYHLHP
jgi:hypothetical protein